MTNNNAHDNHGVERVKTIIDNQQIKGFKKYNSFVRYDKLSLLDWLKHFQEELADALVYSQMAIENIEDESKQTKANNMRARELVHDMAQKQSVLDSFIIKSRKLKINNDELLGKLEISFSVEIFEMLNECRDVFKYWSNKPNDHERILEEYADGLHFLLSLGNHAGQTNATCEHFVNGLETPIQDAGITLFETVKRCVLLPSITEKALQFGMVGQLLGLDVQTIYDAYVAKNRINYERQERGY